MGMLRCINKTLGLFSLRLSRTGKFRLEHPDLSPNLLKNTEMTYDMTRIQSNDLSVYFFKNSTHDLHKWYHYFEVYERYFSRYRDRSDVRILEIGVFRGGSLKMWREYFHPKATIVGIDIDTNCKSFEDPENNIFVEVGDQGDASFLEFISKKFGPFDIIIDDGGHKTSLQIISFNSLYGSSLNDDGIYLVEDVHSNYWPRYQDTDPTFVDFVKPLIDLLHEPYFESVNGGGNMYRGGGAKMYHGLGGSLSA